MWEWIKSLISEYGKAALGSAPSSALSDTIASGAANSGWGNLVKDLTAGNYSSAAGNALRMGADNAKNQNTQNQVNMQPVTAQQPQPAQTQSPLNPFQTESPYLQQLRQMYMR